MIFLCMSCYVDDHKEYIDQVVTEDGLNVNRGNVGQYLKSTTIQYKRRAIV